MSKKEMDEKDMLKQLLKAYHNHEIEEVEPEGEATPSEAFRKRMEKMIHSPQNWNKYKKRDQRRHRVFRTQKVLAVVTLFFMFLLSVVHSMAPTKISASIPEFLLKQSSTSDAIEVLVNLDAISEKDVAHGVPKVELGYVPEGFVLEENRISSQSVSFTFRKVSGENAVIQLGVSFNNSYNTFFLSSEKTTQLYVDAKEIIKAEYKPNAYFYAWKDKEYLVDLYTCNVPEEEIEHIIRSLSITDTSDKE